MHGLKYSREAITDTIIDLMAALRKEKPDVYLQDLEVELSPWWLMHVEALWSYISEGWATPHHMIDGALRAWLTRNTIYPTSGIWYATIEPPMGPLSKDDGRDEKQMPNLVLMRYLRGGEPEEIYYDLYNLTEQEKDVIAGLMRWARARADIILNDTWFALGNPLRQRTYAYTHIAPDNRGIIGIHNPAQWRNETVTLVLDEKAHVQKLGGPFAVAVTYPYTENLGTFRYGDALTLTVPGGEILLLEMVPDRAPFSLPPKGGKYRRMDQTTYRALERPREAGRIRVTGKTVSPRIGVRGSFHVAVPERSHAELVLTVEFDVGPTQSVGEMNWRELPTPDNPMPARHDRKEYHDLMDRLRKAAFKAIKVRVCADGRPLECRERPFRVGDNPALMQRYTSFRSHPDKTEQFYSHTDWIARFDGSATVEFEVRPATRQAARDFPRICVSLFVRRVVELGPGKRIRVKRDGAGMPFPPQHFARQDPELITVLPRLEIGL